MSGDAFPNLYAQSLVFDFGSGVTKAGFSTDKTPTVVLDSLLGIEITPEGAGEPKRVVGQSPADVGKNIYYPLIRRGIVTNYDYLESFVGKILPEFRLNSLENTPVLISKPSFSSIHQKAKIAEIFYEKFGASSLSFQNQTVLNLCAVGATSGCVLDVGHGLTQVGCLVGEFKVTDSFIKAGFGGQDVETLLELLIRKRGIYFKPETEKMCVKNIKENYLQSFGFERFDGIRPVEPETEADQVSVVLPDGEEVILGNERRLAAELLFNPERFGHCGFSLHEMLKASIDTCPYEHKRQLYQNIYLTGGSSNIAGLETRLFHELQKILPQGVGFSVNLDAGITKHQVFAGGSVLASMSQFKDLCVSRQRFAEEGEKAFDLT
jgi:actin-related protein